MVYVSVGFRTRLALLSPPEYVVCILYGVCLCWVPYTTRVLSPPEYVVCILYGVCLWWVPYTTRAIVSPRVCCGMYVYCMVYVCGGFRTRLALLSPPVYVVCILYGVCLCWVPYTTRAIVSSRVCCMYIVWCMSVWVPYTTRVLVLQSMCMYIVWCMSVLGSVHDSRYCLLHGGYVVCILYGVCLCWVPYTTRAIVWSSGMLYVYCMVYVCVGFRTRLAPLSPPEYVCMYIVWCMSVLGSVHDSRHCLPQSMLYVYCMVYVCVGFRTRLAPLSLLQSMLLRGQMIYLAESQSMIFLGSPVVEHLDQLLGKGLHISGIPIHDATRDVILMGEQSKAQVCPFLYLPLLGNGTSTPTPTPRPTAPVLQCLFNLI